MFGINTPNTLRLIWDKKTKCLLEPKGRFNIINENIMSGDSSAHSKKYAHERRTRLGLERSVCLYKSLENDNKPREITINSLFLSLRPYI